MKTQILLTLEFDTDAEVRNPAPLPTPQVVLSEVNGELRQWAATNPFGLRDPEHLRLSLALANGQPDISANGHGKHLAADLRKIAGDLTALAHITENL